MNQTLATDPSTSTLAAARVRRWAKPMRHRGEEVLIEGDLLVELGLLRDGKGDMCSIGSLRQALHGRDVGYPTRRSSTAAWTG